MSRPLRLRRLRLEWWLVSLVAATVVALLVYDRTTDRLDKFAFDVALRFDPHEPDPRILLVAIDTPSLQEAGGWPWPRDLQARLIEALGRGRPKAIAYDVLTVEPAPGDERLAQAIAAAEAPVFTPALLDAPGRNGAPFDLIPPVPQVRSAAAGVGHVSLISDSDGVVRRVRLSENDGGRDWPHLMSLMHRSAGGLSPPVQREPLLIPFAGPAGRFPAISASAVLRGELPPELLRDRLVIVGATAQGLGDHYPTPRGGRGRTMSGVEIMANTLDGLISGRMIGEAGFLPRLATALVPLGLMLTALRLFRPLMVGLATAGLVVLTLGVSLGGLILAKTWLPPGAALAGMALVYPLWGWRSLAAVNGYMRAELEQLRAEPDALAPPSPPGRLDPVIRQATMLNEAIAHVRDMRRFVADSLDQLPDAVFVASPEGRVLLANTAAERLMVSLQPTRPQPREMSAVLGQLRSDDGASIWPPLAEGASVSTSAADGRRFDVQLAPRLSAKGEPLGWIAQVSDVTAVWTAQRRREELIRFLTHDMRSPQASILALVEASKGKGIGAPVVRRIEGYARRTLELADGFIHLARAEALRYELEPLNLPDLLLDAVDELWPQITASGVKMDVIGKDQILLVSGERSLLTRALINLIDNALKHGAQGGWVSCGLKVQGSSDDGGPWALCAIADRGLGVDSKQQAALFEQFQRGADRTDGAGLGLSFVQTVISRHGGRAWCDNNAEGGATFTIALPLLADEFEG